MENQIIGIYCIKNKISNKLYIGSSKNVAMRFKTHLSKLKNNKHSNPYLQNAVNKYGLNNFIFELIEETTIENLINREQYYINLNENNIYNITKEAGTGGGDVVRKQLLLLDLHGNVLDKFESGVQLSNYLNQKLLDYKTINTDSIKNKKYRIVTPDFYLNNIQTIKSWKNYSNKTVHNSTIYWSNKYKVVKDGQETLFTSQKSLAEYIGVSFQRVQQIFKMIDNKEVKKYYHKKTGFSIQYVKNFL